ncbi:MAG TPA: UxaA family hydrolase [Jiangellaceae bacterium]|nr:UxaA family hydrolase [Jiangellaceae bacterium]
MHQSFLVHASGDVVGVAVQDLAPGSAVRGRVQNGGPVELDVLEAVPLGHKIALRDIGAGEQVVEYGAVIGRATKAIRAGEHVHVHNVKGERWA